MHLGNIFIFVSLVSSFWEELGELVDTYVLNMKLNTERLPVFMLS